MKALVRDASSGGGKPQKHLALIASLMLHNMVDITRRERETKKEEEKKKGREELEKRGDNTRRDKQGRERGVGEGSNFDSTLYFVLLFIFPSRC